MTALLDRLPMETRGGLSELAARAEDMGWSAEVARTEGWYAANQQYHARQRLQGAAEMTALLDALGLQPPLTLEAVRDVFLAAIDLFFRANGITGEARVEQSGIRVTISRCPIYDRFTDPAARGVTACGCFARRMGWYDALGIPPDEELLMNRKWDDPVCVTSIHLPLPVF